MQPRASCRDGKPLTQRDTWPRRGHRCSSATDCRCEQSHRHVQSHPCARSPTCQPAGSADAKVPVRRACTCRCPCTRVDPQHTHSPDPAVKHRHVHSLSLPRWCQILKGKSFYYLKGPPVQCLFFFFLFPFLNVFWKWAWFIYSKSVCSPG